MIFHTRIHFFHCSVEYMNMVVLKVCTHEKCLQRICYLTFLNYNSHSDVRNHQVEIGVSYRN